MTSDIQETWFEKLQVHKVVLEKCWGLSHFPESFEFQTHQTKSLSDALAIFSLLLKQ